MFRAFLENTTSEAAELAERSDVLTITPLAPAPAPAYLCAFDLSYIRRLPAGTVDIASGPIMAVLHIPEDYLRSVDHHLYLRVASVLTPDLVHPNILGGTVCLGSAFAPGTSITWLLWELFDIASYQNVTFDERNALNPEACRLLREHSHLIDRLQHKPFLRRERKLAVNVRNL